MMEYASLDIQNYTQDKAIEVADLFHHAVHAIDESIYTQQQKEAWAPTPPNYELWTTRLDRKKPFLAMIDGKIAGFIELDSDGHIDCTYTHPNFQGRGVASALYGHILSIAKQKHFARLYVEVSLTALPFFKKRGFNILKKNELQRNGVTLINYDMELHLESRLK